jgi:hypothetical protein
MSQIENEFSYAWERLDPIRLSYYNNVCYFDAIPSSMPNLAVALDSAIPLLRVTDPAGEVFELEENIPPVPYGPTQEEAEWIMVEVQRMQYARERYHYEQEPYHDCVRREAAEKWWSEAKLAYELKIMMDNMEYESDSDTDEEGYYMEPVHRKRTVSDPEAYCSGIKY